MFELGEYDKSIQYLKRILELEPSNIKSLITIGLSFEMLENYEKDIESYNAVIEYYKTSVDDKYYVQVLLKKANLLVEMDKKDEALQLIDRAREIDTVYVDRVLNLN